MVVEEYYCDICGRKYNKGPENIMFIGASGSRLRICIGYPNPTTLCTNADICPDCEKAIQKLFDSRITAFMEKGDKNNG